MQLLLIDKHHLHIWDLARDRFVGRKRISQQPLIAIFKAGGKGEFGVVSGCAVDVWRVEQDLNYRIVLGGHTGPVVAVHPVNGVPVRINCLLHSYHLIGWCMIVEKGELGVCLAVLGLCVC